MECGYPENPCGHRQLRTDPDFPKRAEQALDEDNHSIHHRACTTYTLPRRWVLAWMSALPGPATGCAESLFVLGRGWINIGMAGMGRRAWSLPADFRSGTGSGSTATSRLTMANGSGTGRAGLPLPAEAVAV